MAFAPMFQPSRGAHHLVRSGPAPAAPRFGHKGSDPCRSRLDMMALALVRGQVLLCLRKFSPVWQVYGELSTRCGRSGPAPATPSSRDQTAGEVTVPALVDDRYVVGHIVQEAAGRDGAMNPQRVLPGAERHKHQKGPICD